VGVSRGVVGRIGLLLVVVVWGGVCCGGFGEADDGVCRAVLVWCG